MTPWRTISVALVANTAGFTSGMARAQGVLGGFGKAGMLAKGGLLAIGAGLIASAAEAIKWESAFAGVRKTVDASEAEFAVLEQGLINLANRLPASRQEIAGVAEAAGALGISKGSLLEFTEVAIGLGVATNVSAEDAATGLAKIANVMGTAEADFDRLGSTLVHLGNNGASTEDEILSMAQRLTGIGNIIGASEADVLGLSNAMASVGIQAELGGGAMQRVLQNIYTSMQEGGTRAEQFASVAGMSAEAFAKAWEEDPIAAFNALIGGLTDVNESGGNVIGMLDNLGIKGTQNRQVVLRLLGANEMLAESLDDAETAWDENNALAEEVAERYKTAASQLEIFRNQVTNVARVGGSYLIPVLLAGLDAGRQFGNWVYDMAVKHGPKLKGVWEDLTDAGEDIGDVLVTMRDRAEPVAETIGKIGGAAVLGGLTAAGQGLATVADRLDRHRILVVGIMTVMTTWAAMSAWPTIVSAFGAITTAATNAAAAVVFSTSIANFGQGLTLLATGLGQVATGIPILGTNLGRLNTGWANMQRGIDKLVSPTVGLLAVTGLIYLTVDALRSAEAQAKAWRREVEEGIDPRSVSDYRDAADQAIEKLRETDKYARDIDARGAGWLGGWKASAIATAQVLTPLENKVLDNAHASKEAKAAYEEWLKKSFQLQGAIRVLGKDLDMPRSQIMRLAKELDLDLTAENHGRNVFIIRGHMRELAESAGRRGEQVAAASTKSVEELEAEAEAWEELEGAVRQNWAATTDIIGAFSGRQSASEVSAGLAEIRAQFDEQLDGIATDAEDYGERVDEVYANRDQALQDYRDQHAVTGDDIASWYGQQIEETNRFAANINEAFALGYDPQLVSRLLVQGPEEAGPIVEAMVSDVNDELLYIVKSGEDAMRNINEQAVEMARLTHAATTATSREMAAELATAMEISRIIARDGSKATADTIAFELGVGVDKVEWIAAGYGITLAKSANAILEAVGADPIAQQAIGDRYRAQAQHAWDNKNSGGLIDGPNVNRDVIPAMLTPDEYVFRQGVVRSFRSSPLGVGFLDDVNAGRVTPGDIMAMGHGQWAGYNAGGHVLLQAGKRLQDAGARITEHPAWDRVDPVHVKNSFHYRNSSGTGADAFDASLAPGQSAREMAFFDHWAPIIAGMGLRVLWRVKGHFDHLHADLGKAGYGMGGYAGGGGGGGMFVPHFAPMPEVPDMGDYLLADVAEASWKATREKVQKWADEQQTYSAVDYGGVGISGGGAEAARGWITQALGILGLPASWIGPALKRAQQESGFNPRAINNWDSNARAGWPTKGIMQMRDDTFRTFAMPGMGDIWNPLHNFVSAFRYILDEYGSIFNLPRGGYNAGGLVSALGGMGIPFGVYDDGGYVPPGLSLYYNGTGRPEPTGHHLAEQANRALSVQVQVTNITHVHVGNEKLGPYVDTRAQTVVAEAYDTEARLERAGRRHGG